jgi:integrase/recombinase XerD
LRACQCEGFERANERDVRGARLFVRHLRETGATPAMHQADMVAAMPPLFLAFCDWMRQHRGTRDTTLHTYRRTIVDALQTLGSNPQRFDATGLRAFVLDRASRHGRCQARVVITALRVFVRYLIASGECQPGLDAAIPTIAGWRLSSLPRYLPATDVERVLTACDPLTGTGARDRAILLLLSRLGLRAGDIYALRLMDIDWGQSTVQVLGKSRRTVQLPLPQEVGDAILHYLATGRPAVQSDHLFLRTSTPVGPFATNSTAVSNIVKRDDDPLRIRVHLGQACASGSSASPIAAGQAHRAPRVEAFVRDDDPAVDARHPQSGLVDGARQYANHGDVSAR